MKQIAQYQDGRLELQEVPRPVPPPGGVLVRTTHSVISIGTEKMKVEQAKMNLLQKAKARPDQVRKVIDTARNIGWKSAYEKVRNRLSSPTPLGYSAAGIVEEVDDSRDWLVRFEGVRARRWVTRRNRSADGGSKVHGRSRYAGAAAFYGKGNDAKFDLCSLPLLPAEIVAQN